MVLAPAKLNLFLEVLGRRADGFHEIETLMVAVTLFDTIYFCGHTRGSHTNCRARSRLACVRATCRAVPCRA